jgi:hypothetical protein
MNVKLRLSLPYIYIMVWFMSSQAAHAGPKLLPFIKGYACYYGQPKVAELSHYPLVILETGQYNAAQIAQIKKAGVTVIGYLSVGEVLESPRSKPPTTPPAKNAPHPLALAPYYLDRDGDGTPDQNGSWNSLYVDARAAEWQRRVLEELAPLVLQKKGADGLFLDTLDTVDVYPETKSGMIDLVKKLRAKFPKAPIIANRGFTIIESIVPSIDAVLFEAFSTHYSPETNRSHLHPASDLEWVDGVLARIKSAGGANPAQVLVLDYADPKDPKVKAQAIARAKAAGLTYSISTGSLDKLPIEGGAGNPPPAIK